MHATAIMAQAGTEIPPSPIPPGALHQFLEPPLQNPFPTFPDQSHTSGQNHDRSNNTASISPPAQAAMSDFIPPATEALLDQPTVPQDVSQLPIPQDPAQPPTTSDAQNLNQQPNQQPNQERRRSQSEDSSGSEHSHSDSEDEPEQEGDGFPWSPLQEDTSAPGDDEIEYIESRGEHSALDYKYWEKKAYFDPHDPEIVPGESGRIDWLVEHFNGTKENPNKEAMMRSDVVRIGGYDWRIKFYPRGNDSDFLSAYVECATMQSEDFSESEDFVQPPLPFISGMEQLKKRRTVAAQVQIVMYNPSEPRVYEYRHEAHQFTKSLPDYGWKCFTRYPRREFGFRMHGQRQAILRDDKLSFSAYIRVVDDPTGCMWSHSDNAFTDSVALTGLRPFSPQMPLFAAQLPLLHFAPFRNFISKCSDTKIVFWFQTLLWKCLSRKRSEFYGEHEVCVASDTVAWLRYAVKWLKKETDVSVLEQLVGTLNPDQGAAVCGNRLKTGQLGSIQAAVNAHPTQLETPALLTLELERQEFHRGERKWRKLTNKVEMEDQITVGETNYTLFAFSTHNVDLESNKYNVYVRPHGPTSQWYQYTEGSVKCLTRKQSVEKCSGVDPAKDGEKEKHHSSRHSPFAFWGDRIEVAHVAFYVRQDAAPIAFAAPIEEEWNVRENVRKGIPPTFDGVVGDKPPATAAYETFAETVDNDPQPPEAPAAPTAPVEPVELEPPRRSSFGIDAGYATPNCWQMDGDDVVMSDAGEEEEEISKEAQPPEVSEDQLTMHTIDHMGRDYFQGQMLGNQYYGQGHLIAMSGDEYKGSFKDGKKHGRGTMTYASTGNVYEGEWEDDEHHGQGILTELKSGNVFEGGWNHGKKHGQFVLKGTVTDEDKGCCSICYDKDITTAFYDCGHVLACRDCAKSCDTCPVCRKRVLARLDLFGVKLMLE